jgi:hypothetical protein
MLLVTGSLQACHRWVVRTEPPREVLGTKEHSVIRLTRSDGVHQEIVEARIDGDSLVGYSEFKWRPERARIAVSLGEVQSIDVQRIHRGRTALFVLGVGTVVLIGMVMVALSSLDLGASSGYPLLR